MKLQFFCAQSFGKRLCLVSHIQIDTAHIQTILYLHQNTRNYWDIDVSKTLWPGPGPCPGPSAIDRCTTSISVFHGCGHFGELEGAKGIKGYTLPETNSSHLKMDGWNTILDCA